MNPLLPVGVVALLISGMALPVDVEDPSLTVTQDEDGYYLLDIDQDRAGPGYLSVKVRYWDGATGGILIAASAPFTIAAESILSASYVTDDGKVYRWSGGVDE